MTKETLGQIATKLNRKLKTSEARYLACLGQLKSEAISVQKLATKATKAASKASDRANSLAERTEKCEAEYRSNQQALSAFLIEELRSGE